MQPLRHRRSPLVLAMLLAACAHPRRDAAVAQGVGVDAPKVTSGAPTARVVDPSSLFDAGAPVEGVIAIARDTALYPTAQAARGAPKRAPTAPAAGLVIYAVTGAMDGVVRIQTGQQPMDCLDAGGDPDGLAPTLAIDAFVARDQLVARLAEPVVVERADGSGARAEMGAPLRVFDDGRAELLDPALARVIGPLPRSSIALATPPGRMTSVAQAASDGPDHAGRVGRWSKPLAPLVCEHGPESLEAWRAGEETRRETRRQQGAEAAAHERAEAAEAAFQRCLTDEAAKAARPKKPSSVLEVMPSCAELRASGVFEPAPTELLFDGMRGPEPGPRLCEVDVQTAEFVELARADAAARVLSDLAFTSSTVGVGQRGTFQASLMLRCGELRVALPPAAVAKGNPGAVGTLFMGQRKAEPRAHVRRAATLTWTDGAPAGSVTKAGSVPRDSLVQAADGRLCMSLPRLAERVCLAATDVCATATACTAP